MKKNIGHHQQRPSVYLSENPVTKSFSWHLVVDEMNQQKSSDTWWSSFSGCNNHTCVLVVHGAIYSKSSAPSTHTQNVQFHLWDVKKSIKFLQSFLTPKKNLSKKKWLKKEARGERVVVAVNIVYGIGHGCSWCQQLNLFGCTVLPPAATL